GRQAPVTPGLAEVLAVLGNLHLTGHIKNAANPPQGVDRDAKETVSRLFRLGLERIVHSSPNVRNIAEKIRNARADGYRCDIAVSRRHRLEDHAVYALVKAEDGAVERL